MERQAMSPTPARPVAIAPSILAADMLRLGDELAAVEAAGAERIHVDVMDGVFVPNLSLGIPIVEAVRRGTALPVEVHLMITAPERYVDAFARAGSDQIIVHQEVSPHLHRTVHQVKELDRRISVALNPATPETVLGEIIGELDAVLVMTVNPGFGGQRFITSTLDKIRRLRRHIDARRLDCDIEVDGGIDAETAPLAVAAGANLLVAGTSVFAHREGPGGGMRHLLGCCAGVAFAG
jgi:ribulose-phosphate 3-epimerase